MFGEMHSHGRGGVLPAAEPASCPVLNAHSYILGCVVDRRSQPAWRNHVEPEHTRLENCLAWMVEVPCTSLFGDQIAALGGAGASKTSRPKLGQRLRTPQVQGELYPHSQPFGSQVECLANPNLVYREGTPLCDVQRELLIYPGRWHSRATNAPACAVSL